jgi:hypothetical protein
MQQKYLHYWWWFRGAYLAEEKGRTEDGERVLRFPLGINAVRNFSRKHAAILLGEENIDSTNPFIKTIAKPKLPLNGDDATEEDKRLAKLFENIVNEVWSASGGRSLQLENAILSQFLGGCVFRLSWEPENKELTIPIKIRIVYPDFFMPVWSSRNYWELLEAFVVYRIPGITAKLEYGYETSAHHVTYMEHWTPQRYTFMIDGEPIGTKYDKLENPFGFVPFCYIPHLKEGGNYGSSIVEDIEGLVREYNSRLADTGDAVQENVHRRRNGFNLPSTIKSRQVGDISILDLGRESPAQKNPPTINTENPPVMSPELTKFSKEQIWPQLLREGSLGDISFGEDEGSQRSALTLAFRMYPSTSHGRMERALWTEGMITIAKMIGKMVSQKQSALKSLGSDINLPKEFLRRVQIGVDWLPMIPRDREQIVNEIVLRRQSNLASLEHSLEVLGDVRNVNDEAESIRKDMEFAASLTQKEEQGPDTSINSPVAESVTGDG